MNEEFFRRLGQFYVIWRQASNPILFGCFIGTLVYLWPTNDRHIHRPTVIAVKDNGNIVSLSCDDKDGPYRQIALDLGERLSRVLFDYNQEERKSYAQKYNNFKKYIEPGSPSEPKIKKIALDNLGNEHHEGSIRKESSMIILDKANAVSMSQDGKYYLSLDGLRTQRRTSGNVNEKIRMDITMKRGGENEVFHVHDIDLKFL